jgi:hypothetical protein
MSSQFRDTLAVLAETASEELSDLLEECETQVFAAVAVGKWLPATEAMFEGTPAPLRLLDGAIRTPDDLRRAIERTDMRWQLDVIVAVSDDIDRSSVR